MLKKDILDRCIKRLTKKVTKTGSRSLRFGYTYFNQINSPKQRWSEDFWDLAEIKYDELNQFYPVRDTISKVYRRLFTKQERELIQWTYYTGCAASKLVSIRISNIFDITGVLREVNHQKYYNRMIRLQEVYLTSKGLDYGNMIKTFEWMRLLVFLIVRKQKVLFSEREECGTMFTDGYVPSPVPFPPPDDLI